MNLFNVLVGIGGLGLALLGIALTIRANRRKLVTFDIRGPISLVSILPDVAGLRLTILYRRDEGDPVTITNAYLHYVRIANLGRESVKKEDLAPEDPLRIQIRGGSVLELAVAGSTRSVLGFSLSSLQEEDSMTSSHITFDFLDYQDGAVLRCLTDSPNSEVRILGTVIGMPEGIRQGVLLGVRQFTMPSLIVMILVYVAVSFAVLTYFGEPVGQVSGGRAAILVTSISLFAFILIGIWFKYFVPGPDDGWPKSMRLPIDYSPIGLLSSHQVISDSHKKET